MCNQLQEYLAENIGFEPMKGFLDPYSLSRGAPSSTRPILQRHNNVAEEVRLELTRLIPKTLGFQDRCR